jgi:Asp-tRNA(Asn)/Glu-tRNA(Gln) amidotransferase A subunit family amidase
VAVPSRLSAQRSSERPFEGWRIALKDAFDVNGLRTSICNRAYLELYPSASSTAPSIAHIIDGGAIILGKTKLSSFLSREEPSESVDFQTAWNPRGDGYQTPGGSSSGSAAAVAAYEWVRHFPESFFSVSYPLWSLKRYSSVETRALTQRTLSRHVLLLNLSY